MGERARVGGAPLRVPVVHAEGPEIARDLMPGVGIVPFYAGDSAFLAIAVRIGFRIDEVEHGGTAVPLAKGNRLTYDVPSRFGVGAGEVLDAASDFVPMKSACDLVVVGHARARAATDTIHGAVRLLAHDGRPLALAGFVARSGAPATAIPLVAPYLSGLVPGAGGRLGPVVDSRRAIGGVLDEHTDLAVFGCAEHRIAFGSLSAISLIELKGLLPYREGDETTPGDLSSTRLVALPGLQPVVSVDVAGRPDVPLRTVLDTLFIDSDAQRISIVWRATAGPFESYADLERILVSGELVGRERDPSERRSDTQRGKVVFALTEDDARDGGEPPDDDPRLRYESMRTLGEVAPEPRISIEDYARVSAQLAEWPDQRATTLERVGFDEERWGVEERAWLERFATDAMNGQSELAGLYGREFLAAQDALASPRESELTLRDYAGMRAAIEGSIDMMRVLEDAQLTLAQWMRLDRKWSARAEQDPLVAAELDDLLEELAQDADIDQIELPYDDGDEGDEGDE